MFIAGISLHSITPNPTMPVWHLPSAIFNPLGSIFGQWQDQAHHAFKKEVIPGPIGQDEQAVAEPDQPEQV